MVGGAGCGLGGGSSAYQEYYSYLEAKFLNNPNTARDMGWSPQQWCQTLFSGDVINGRVPSEDNDTYLDACLDAHEAVYG